MGIELFRELALPEMMLRIISLNFNPNYYTIQTVMKRTSHLGSPLYSVFSHSVCVKLSLYPTNFSFYLLGFSFESVCSARLQKKTSVCLISRLATLIFLFFSFFFKNCSATLSLKMRKASRMNLDFCESDLTPTQNCDSKVKTKTKLPWNRTDGLHAHSDMANMFMSPTVYRDG